jgi:hypothetical protein
MDILTRGLAATLLTAAAGAALVALPASAGAGGAQQPGGDDGHHRGEWEVSPSLAPVRRATAAYHDPAVALADGFVPTDVCSAHPELGGMGLHYVHPERLADPALVATEPEILLYEPTADGGVRLVGVEWFSVDPDQDVTTDDGRPSLLGVPFDGPMVGHEPGMPVHFDLHAWIWKDNPAGTFTAWNPDVSCAG